jgi:thiol-disulfide isomerase/thioredoxin
VGKKKNLYGSVFFLLAGMVTALLVFFVLHKKVPVYIDAVLYDPCGGCTADISGCKPCDAVDALSLQILETLEQENLADRVQFKVENLRSSGVEARTRELCAKFGLSYEELEFPLVMVNEQEAYQGTNAVAQAAATAKKKSPFMDSFFSVFLREKKKKDTVPGIKAKPGEMIYFYSPLCEDCKRAHPLFDEALLRQKGITLVGYDILENGGYELFTQYLEAYASSAAGLNVPLVVWQDKIFTGSAEIADLFKTL